MHMADALISPAVGGTLWAVSAGLVTLASRKMRQHFDSGLVPLMGVLGAFVFAAQMINFTIPGTGSSGHLGGAMLLTILLGPWAAFLTISSVLVVQALFFADGGLLALGCNIFNLGFFPCFVAWPLVYRPIAGDKPSRARLMTASVLAVVVGLQLGAFGVVMETVASGISSLPFTSFVLLMQPIHLAIGVVEGVVTAAVVAFVHGARPEVLSLRPAGLSWSMQKLVASFAIMALLTGGVLSWFASAWPDGLEWSVAAISGQEELEAPQQGVHATLASVQDKTAVMPDYAFKKQEAASADVTGTAESASAGAHAEKSGKGGKGAAEVWPAVDAGTSTAGVLGGLLTLLLAGCVGMLLRRRVSVPGHGRS